MENDAKWSPTLCLLHRSQIIEPLLAAVSIGKTALMSPFFSSLLEGRIVDLDRHKRRPGDMDQWGRAHVIHNT
jgi:hypothetical protein